MSAIAAAEIQQEGVLRQVQDVGDEIDFLFCLGVFVEGEVFVLEESVEPGGRVVGRHWEARQESRVRRRSSLASFGLALPWVAFITLPMKNPRSFLSPPR